MITLAANIAYSSAKKMRKAATVNRSNRTSHCTSMAEICKEEEVAAWSFLNEGGYDLRLLLLAKGRHQPPPSTTTSTFNRNLNNESANYSREEQSSNSKDRGEQGCNSHSQEGDGGEADEGELMIALTEREEKKNMMVMHTVGEEIDVSTAREKWRCRLWCC